MRDFFTLCLAILVLSAPAAANEPGSIPDCTVTTIWETLRLPVIGSSPVMRELKREIVSYAGYPDMHVLLVGETGSGKEGVASALHELSSRKRNDYRPKNCASLGGDRVEAELFGFEKGAFTGAHEKQPGIFEYANGGTIFLDELPSLPLDGQVKLLRIVEGHPYQRMGGVKDLVSDARVIAGCNENPEEMVRAGKLRQDLYFRLNVLRLEIPPLREHLEDIPELVAYFVKAGKYATTTEIDPEIFPLLQAYHWPGNIRQLKNVILQAYIHGGVNAITVPEIKRALAQAAALESALTATSATTSGFVIDSELSLEELTRRYILHVLESCNWDKAKATRILKMSRRTLNNKLSGWGITSPN